MLETPPVDADLESRWSMDDSGEALPGQLEAGNVLRQLHLDAPVPQRLLLRGQHRGTPLRLVVLRLRSGVEGHKRLLGRALGNGGGRRVLRQGLRP